MKTNVSIKFSSIEEYREIEKNLIELGYVLLLDDKVNKGYVMVNNSSKTFGKFEYILIYRLFLILLKNLLSWVFAVPRRTHSYWLTAYVAISVDDQYKIF